MRQQNILISVLALIIRVDTVNAVGWTSMALDGALHGADADPNPLTYSYCAVLYIQNTVLSTPVQYSGSGAEHIVNHVISHAHVWMTGMTRRFRYAPSFCAW